MCEFIINSRKCKISSKDTYCHIHKNFMLTPTENVKLLKKIKNQAQEISILNERLSIANRKLQIIDNADRIKYELSRYVTNRSFRQAIDDPALKEHIERIFGSPQDECIDIYNTLIHKRNILTHRYTSRNWVDDKIKSKKKTKHGYSIKNLCNSIKTYELLKK